MTLGKCPYCKDGQIEVRKKEVFGKKVILYACSNAKWILGIDEETFELSDDSSCSFKIWQNSLSRYGKWLKNNEVRQILSGEDIKVKLFSKKYGKKIEYEKYITLDKEYGISVIWEN